ncbi:hypothetical protein STEG23_019262 [Scotinomys teguina]
MEDQQQQHDTNKTVLTKEGEYLRRDRRVSEFRVDVSVRVNISLLMIQICLYSAVIDASKIFSIIPPELYHIFYQNDNGNVVSKRAKYPEEDKESGICQHYEPRTSDIGTSMATTVIKCKLKNSEDELNALTTSKVTT